MKKIYYILVAMFAMSMIFIACSDEDALSTATPDDDPRILNPIFPDHKDGLLPIISNINRDVNLTMELVVTPADYTTILWQLDGHEVHEGNMLDISLKSGTYVFKVVVSTDAGKSTYREGLIRVNPLPDDIWSTEVGLERIIIPGSKAIIYGENLSRLKSIIIDGKTISDITYVENENDSYIEYAVPIDLAEGDHRVILVDTGGIEYGGNMVKVTKGALITSGADRIGSNREWRMSGFNLDQVISLTFAEQNITEFIEQTATDITIICPELEDGEYKLTGKTKTGDDLQFYKAGGIITEKYVSVSSETVIWEGHHYVSWDLPDGDPNKMFNLIGQDVFASISPGSIMNIHYSVASDAEYHQLRTTSGRWDDLPGTSVIEFSEDGIKEVELTQEVLDKIQNEDGFLCIGHGYYVDTITVQ